MGILKIAIIGTGNVAWHFSKIFTKEGHLIKQVFSRTFKNARLFADEFNAQALESLDSLNKELDLIVIATNDEAIASISRSIHHPALVIHTSGTTAMDALSNERTGVVWAIHSMRKGIPSSYKQTPFVVETKLESDRSILTSAFRAFEKNIYYANSEQRLRIHLAAVVANNFVNHLFTLSEKLVNESGVSFDILKPMIDAHIEGIHNLSPAHLQTGPAVRNDQTTINQHLELLHSQPEIMKLYQMLTDSIQKMYLHK